LLLLSKERFIIILSQEEVPNRKAEQSEVVIHISSYIPGGQGKVVLLLEKKTSKPVGEKKYKSIISIYRSGYHYR